MKDETKSAHLLELKKPEVAILRVLSREPMSVAEIARRSNLPRMTAFVALGSLKHRGLVERTLKGKRHFWMRVEANQASGLLQTAFDAIINPGGHGERKLFIKTHDGADELFSVLRDFFEAHAGERLYGFQSTKSAKECIDTLGMDRVVAINELIKEKGIIVEAVLGKSFAKTGREYGPEWQESYVGRAAAITVVLEEFLDLDVDIFVFSRSLLIFHWKEETAVEIMHPEVVATFRKLVRAFSMLGRKVDINALVAEANGEKE
jgi:hypothetical protein